MHMITDHQTNHCLKVQSTKKSSKTKKNKNIHKLPFMLNPKVLLVEDTPTIQYIHTEFLKTLGCDVDLAKDGYEAITRAVCDNNSYDLILMDIGLPDMEGAVAASIIRSLEDDQRRTPIIAITGYGDYFSEKYLSAGIDEIFVKPVQLEGLADILKRWLAHYLEPV